VQPSVQDASGRKNDRNALDWRGLKCFIWLRREAIPGDGASRVYPRGRMNLPSGCFRITKAPGRMFFDNMQNGLMECWSIGAGAENLRDLAPHARSSRRKEAQTRTPARVEVRKRGRKFQPIQSGINPGQTKTISVVMGPSAARVGHNRPIGAFRTFPSERARKPDSALKNQTELKRIRFNPL